MGDGLFAKHGKIKYIIHIEVLFTDLVLLTNSIQTFKEQVERFKRAMCTSGLSDKANVRGEKILHYVYTL